MQEPLSIILEFARAADAGDPFAFRFCRQEYLLRSGHGSFESATFPWDEELLADLSALHKAGRDPVVLQRMGEKLRRFLAAAGFAAHEPRLQEALRRGQRVVLTLCSAAAELYALPWELLTLTGSGQHLGELPGVLVRYEWPQTHTTPEQPDPRPAGGRVLLCWSAAGGAVPAAEHLEAIARAARREGLHFDPQRDVLPGASMGRIAAALVAAQQKGPPIAILHLLAHGAAAGATFGLVLDGEETTDGPVVADAGRLRQVLSPFAAMVRLAVVCACNSGNNGALGNQLGSIAQALHRAGFAQVLASRFPLSVAGSTRLTQGLYESLLGDSASLETALLAARARVAKDCAHLDWASLQLYARVADGEDGRPVILRPYRGLLAFQPEHRQLFFGRDREIAEIEQRLTGLGAAGRPRLLVVAGASGTGKSSLVLAGVVPRLLAERTFCRIRPGAQPQTALDQALAAASGEARPILLVVDQLEELFTHTQDARLRDAFSRRLYELATDPSGQVTVLCTLRVDFLGRCAELALDAAGQRMDTLVYDEAHRVFVAQLGSDVLREAIEEPARRVGLRLEEGLASRLVQDVGSEPGALPLLSDMLDILWQQRQGRVLTQAAYDSVGGISGALRKRADALVLGLTPDAQKLVRRLLVRLVSIDEESALGTRRRVPLSRLLPMGADCQPFRATLEVLLQARLLVTDGEAEAETIEVAHEALIRRWERLSMWVREDRRMLAELERLAAWTEQWEEMGTLLEGPQLGYAIEVSERWQEDIPAAARALLDASNAREERRARARRRLFVGTTLAAVLFAGLGWFGWYHAVLAQREAQRARDWMRIFAVHEMQSKANHDPQQLASLLREVELAEPARLGDWRDVAGRALSALSPGEPALGTSARLRKQLWQATQLCLTPDERMHTLMERADSAARQAGSCQQMVRCLKSPTHDYAACLREFQSRQGNLFRSY